ncbi:DUF1120 domain-containing protein [Candidatus Regiella endosymbiont of Tuberolachnus salignus]|uniref:DUF1120 domain-containing protein n=1 Tax=Candidatus Regiella endosymbiont of Tuberolachnus salignus TaxID=3077956 RepID=UPI0030D15EAE
MLLKKKGVWLASVLVLNSWVGGALAAEQDSATLTVRAKIIPGACKIELFGVENGNILDFQGIKSSELIRGDKVLPAKNISVSIKCDADTKISLSTTDDKKGEAEAQNDRFYLRNTLGDTILGFYKIKIKNDSVIVESSYHNGKMPIFYSTERAADNIWHEATSSLFFSPQGSVMFNEISIAKKNDSINVPVALKTLMIGLEVEPTLNKITGSAIAQNIEVEGKNTFTIKYL